MTVELGDDAFAAAERLGLEVFTAMGFTESNNGSCAEYEPWQRLSRFATVLNDRGQLRGIVRVLRGTYSSLPVGKLPTDREAPDGLTLEYASLAVLPDDRGAGIAEALYRAVWVEAVRIEARQLAAVVDPWLHELLRDHYGFPFEQIGPSTRYMGGDVIPIAMSMDRLHQELPMRRPTIASWLLDGLTQGPSGAPDAVFYRFDQQ